MTGTKLITTIIILATIVGLIVYDIVIVIEPTPGDTISALTLKAAMGHPFIPFATGVLCGHLFWPMSKITKTYMISALVVLILIGIAMLVLDISGMIPTLNPALWLVIGVPAGHFGWPQQWRQK